MTGHRSLGAARRRLAAARVAVATGVATLGLLGLGGRADAHAELLSTEPAAGARLDTPPPEVLLHFSEGVDLTGQSLEVLDAAGGRVEIGAAEHPDGDRTAVTAELPDLGDGAYVVAWRVVSSDSHPIGGAFTFRVGEGDATTTADDQALIFEVLGGSHEGDRALGAVFGVVRFVTFAGVTVLVGAALALALAWLWPDGRDDPRARCVLAVSWWATVVATVVSIPLQGAYATGGTLADAFSPGVIADELGNRAGRAWVARLVVLAVAAVAAPALRRAREPVARAAAVAGGLALIATVSLTGHAVSGDIVPVAFATDLAHLAGVSVSVWLGGLALVLFALLWRPAIRATDEAAEAAEAAGVVARFSPVAFGAVVGIVASGTVQGVRQVGGYDALLETSYGRLLVLKVTLVAAMLVAAMFSRAWVRQRAATAGAYAAASRPSSLSPGPGAKAVAAPAASAGAGSPQAPLSVLRRSVAAEAGLAVAVLAVTALLVNAVPGGSTGAGDRGGGPFSTQLTEDGIVLTLDVDPAEVGPVGIHLYLNEPGGAPVEAEEVTATLGLPERDLGPIDVPLVDFGQGHYSADGAEIPLPGDWELEVVARTSDIDQTVFDTSSPFPEPTATSRGARHDPSSGTGGGGRRHRLAGRGPHGSGARDRQPPRGAQGRVRRAGVPGPQRAPRLGYGLARGEPARGPPHRQRQRQAHTRLGVHGRAADARRADRQPRHRDHRGRLQDHVDGRHHQPRRVPGVRDLRGAPAGGRGPDRVPVDPDPRQRRGRRWIDEPTDDGEEPERPAPLLTLVGAEDEAGGGAADEPEAASADSESASGLTVENTASKDDVDSANTLAVAGLVAGIIGLLAAGFAVVRTRRS